MNETINAMLKEQFGIGEISKKTWFVMTDDIRNIAKVTVRNGRFYPAILLEEIRGETKADALTTFKNCFRSRVYAIVESVEEALNTMSGPMIKWNGEVIRKVPSFW